MKKSFLLLLILLSFFCAAQGKLRSSTVTNDWNGHVRLDRCVVNATIHNTYIEIEEEAELTPIGISNPSADQHYNLLISGGFALPKNAVLTGAIMWDGDKILKAQLKHEHDADNQFEKIKNINSRGNPDIDSLETSSLQLSMLQKGTSTDSLDYYTIAIGQVRWKSNTRIRLHYIVPLRYHYMGTQSGTIPQMDIPHIFADACSEIPESYELNLLGGPTTTEVKLFRSDKTITHTLPTTLIDNFTSPAYTVRKIGIDKAGIITKSTFPTDDTTSLNGEFMHLWTQIPDSLFLAAGLKREVVFLWRWENENSLVNWKVEQDKFLTLYGKKVLRQAQDIQNAMIRLMYSKAGVALHVDRTRDDEGYEKDTTFRMAYKNSYEATQLLNYLGYIMEDNGANIVSEIDGYQITDDQNDTLIADTIKAICEEGSADFEIALDTILNLFSKDEKLIKHVVVVTAGKRRTDKKMFYIDELKEGFEEITFSGYGIDQKFPDGYWPGVNLHKIIEENQLTNGENYEGFQLPRSKAASFLLKIKSEDNIKTEEILGEKSQDKSVYYDNIYFSGHAAKTWNDTLLWEAQDEQGNILASFAHVPLVEKMPADTNIAMLWGGSSTPFSEVLHPTTLGYTLGFVDNYFSLLAHTGDSLDADLQKLIEDGGAIDFIQIDEKHPETKNSVEKLSIMKRGLHSVSTKLNLTHFNIYIGDSKEASLKIYDLKGRLLKEFTKEMLTGKISIEWDGIMSNGASISNGMYIAVAHIGTSVQTKTFVR